MRKSPFPDLSAVQQKATHPDLLRHWARWAYEPLSPIDPAWSPIVIEECQAINALARARQAIPPPEEEAFDLITPVQPLILQSVRRWDRGSLQEIVKDNLDSLAELVADIAQDTGQTIEDLITPKHIQASPHPDTSIPQYPISMENWEDDSVITLDLGPTLAACKASGVAPILSKVAASAEVEDALSIYLRQT